MMSESVESQVPNLIIPEIITKNSNFQRVSPQPTNVTDRRTDRRTNRQLTMTLVGAYALGPCSFQLGTLPTRIANLLCMMLLCNCMTQQQKTRSSAIAGRPCDAKACQG